MTVPRRQWASLKILLGIGLAVPVVVLIVASVQTVAPMSMLMRDPVSIANLPPYTGAISNLGVFAWCAAGSISLFAALTLFATDAVSREAWMLFWGAGLTFMLMFDDFFTVHEVFAYYSGIAITSSPLPMVR